MSAEPHPATALLTLHAEAFGQVMRVRFMGELSERTAPECQLDLREPLDGPEPIVVLDIGGLTAVDASGLEALRAVKRELETHGRRMLLSSVSNGMARTLFVDGSADGFDVLGGGVRSGSQCAVPHSEL